MLVPSLLMVVSYSSANMERLKDGNVELDARVNIYLKKICLLLMLNLTY